MINNIIQGGGISRMYFKILSDVAKRFNNVDIP